MTKATLLKTIAAIPVDDDAEIFVSTNNEDMEEVRSVGWSTPDESITDKVCINFDV